MCIRDSFAGDVDNHVTLKISDHFSRLTVKGVFVLGSIGIGSFNKQYRIVCSGDDVALRNLDRTTQVENLHRSLFPVRDRIGFGFNRVRRLGPTKLDVLRRRR